jgi:hypothetical protein
MSPSTAHTVRRAAGSDPGVTYAAKPWRTKPPMNAKGNHEETLGRVALPARTPRLGLVQRGRGLGIRAWLPLHQVRPGDGG